VTVNHQRPVNLDLSTLKFPPMAIASILHRISGMALFLLLPLMMFFLSRSLQSPESFAALQVQLTSPYCKGLLWAFSTALIYHILAGFRHMIMDIGFGEQLATARRSAIALIALAILLTLCLGVWIW
jgi:succinate dehydrogenase / fumarate reductase cytochrome b subunit